MQNEQIVSTPPALPTGRGSWIVNHSPVYYGWLVLLVGSLGMIMTSPGQTYAVSIFIEHFIADLGISRSWVSTLYTAGTLIGSFALPLVGRQIDRRGPRVMVGVIAGLFGLACVYMGFVLNGVMLLLGFIGIRMLGQGSLGLVSQNVINQWWVRRRGTVMGISGLLMSLLGVGTFPNLINWLIPHFGWRQTYIILGGLLLMVMVPLGLLFFRDRPEKYGLIPDGKMRAVPQGRAATPEIAEESWLLPEANRTVAFWVMALGVALIALLSTGLFFHMVSIFADNGLPATVAASVFLPIAVSTAILQLGSGILTDRVPLRFILAAALFCQALALIMAQFLTSVPMALLYGVILGAPTALMGTVHNVGWASYFGRAHLGSITGFATTILIAGSAFGPMPLGIFRDLTGSYNLALTVLAALPLALGLVSLFIKKPTRGGL
jgi:sugar phosphate permease